MSTENVHINPQIINLVKRIGQENDLVPSNQPHPSVKLVNASTLEFVLQETVLHLTAGGEGDEVVTGKLEGMGGRIGWKLAERYTKDKNRFVDSLEIIKFICKEFWFQCFKKQVDHLKTNHRGVYVLYDNQFSWLLKLSDFDVDESIRMGNMYAWFTCGLVRGALGNLGIQATVTPELANLPQCAFQIKLSKI